MIIITAVIQAKKGKEEEVAGALRGMIPKVRAEAGAIAYVLHRSTTNPGKFFFYERYKDQAAFDYHGSTPYFRDLFKKIRDLIVDAPEVEFYEELDGIHGWVSPS